MTPDEIARFRQGLTAIGAADPLGETKMSDQKVHLPDPFDGFPRAFNAWWEQNSSHFRCPKEEVFQHKLKWINAFLSHADALIPEPPHVACAVETRQQYKGFSGDEIVQLLRSLGHMARMLYTCERDVLIGSHGLDPDPRYPLQRIYIDCLEWVVNMVATFTQEPGTSGFIDFSTRLAQILDDHAQALAAAVRAAVDAERKRLREQEVEPLMRLARWISIPTPQECMDHAPTFERHARRYARGVLKDIAAVRAAQELKP